MINQEQLSSKNKKNFFECNYMHLIKRFQMERQENFEKLAIQELQNRPKILSYKVEKIIISLKNIISQLNDLSNIQKYTLPQINLLIQETLQKTEDTEPLRLIIARNKLVSHQIRKITNEKFSFISISNELKVQSFHTEKRKRLINNYSQLLKKYEAVKQNLLFYFNWDNNNQCVNRNQKLFNYFSAKQYSVKCNDQQIQIRKQKIISKNNRLMQQQQNQLKNLNQIENSLQTLNYLMGYKLYSSQGQNTDERQVKHINQLKNQTIKRFKLKKQRQIEALELYNQQKYLNIIQQRRKQSQMNLIKTFLIKEIPTKFHKQKSSLKLDRVLGGGQCCSVQSSLNDQQICNQLECLTLTNKDQKLNKGFLLKYNTYITDMSHRMKILQEKEEEDEIGVIIQECLNNYKKIITVNNSVYRSYVIEIFEVILQYMISGALHIDNKCYDKLVNKMNIFVDHIKSQVKQHSCQDFLFFSQLISDLNDLPLYEDSFNRQKLKSCSQFVTIIVKNELSNHNQQPNEKNLSTALKQGEELIQPIKSYTLDKQDKLEYVWEIVDRVNERVKSLTKDVFFRQIALLGALRIERFGQSKHTLNVEEEILYYIDQFIEFTEKQTSSHLILCILVQINYLFERKILNYLNNKNQNSLKNDIASSIISMKNQKVQQFLNILQQKAVQTSNFFEQFFSFSVKDTTYRFLSKQILLNYNTMQTTQEVDQEGNQQLWVHLVYSYVTEKNESVKAHFYSNSEFVDKVNNENTEEIAEQVVSYQKVRKGEFQKYKMSVEEFEQQESPINDKQDFEAKIQLNQIEKLEFEQRQRIDRDIGLQDDTIQEEQDLYIEQSLSFLNGNNIFRQLQILPASFAYNFLSSEESNRNAIEFVIENFIIPNLSEEQNEQCFGQHDQKHKCRILGITGEGGTGKSILLKKLETTFLKEKDLIFQKYQKQVNIIPFLIEFKDLDSKNPSIESYLMNQEMNIKQIEQLKNISKCKIILLDGYDEYAGDYFRVYYKLKLNEWKNTFVIISSKLENFNLGDVSSYFSKDDEDGKRDEESYCIVQLNQFQRKDVDEYSQKFFNYYQSKQQSKINEDYNKIMEDSLNNTYLENLLLLPINLNLFTNMIRTTSVSDLKELIKDISDQIQIYELFFQEQFNTEALEFMNSYLTSNKKDQQLQRDISMSYFIYFQTIAMQMFINKGIQQNFLQLDTEKIKFKFQQSIQQQLSNENQYKLLEKIQNYVNSKIITRVKEIKIQKEQNNNQEAKQVQIIEFKHRSFFEYFVAKAMKFDFDIHGNNISELDISQLQSFSINKKYIMTTSRIISEQQILLKFYKLIKPDIDSTSFKESYYQNDIKKNNKFIQYLKRSSISKAIDVSLIDVGSSNLLSALFISKFAYPHLTLSKCSFSKAYIPYNKSISLSFDQCNLNESYLMNENLQALETSLTKKAHNNFCQNELNSQTIFQSYGVAFYQNLLISIGNDGFISSYRDTNQGFQQQYSRKISYKSLNTINTTETKIIVSTFYSLFEINPTTLEIDQSFKFSSQIESISVFKDKYVLKLQNQKYYFGNISQGFKYLQMEGNDPILSNKYIITNSNNNMLIYDIESNFKLIKQIPIQISLGKFNQQENTLITILQNQIQIWSLEKNFEFINSIQAHYSTIHSTAISADGKYFVTGSQDQTCKIWDVKKGYNLIKTIQSDNYPIYSIAFSENGKFLVTVTKDNTCNIWNVEKDFEQINIIQGHTNEISSAAFSVDGKYLATGSKDQTCKIWNLEKGLDLFNTIQGHTNQIFSVAFSVDGKYLATGSEDTTCKIWNVQKGFELINTIQGHTNTIYSVAFSTDGKYLATGSEDTNCKIWNVQRGFELLNTIEDNSPIYSVTFSPCGMYLATGSEDSTCKIWNVQRGFEQLNFTQRYSSKILQVAFSSDGKYLATGCEDNNCRIWDVEKYFILIRTIPAHYNCVNSIAFSADGRFLATGSSDNNCKIWSIENGFEFILSISNHSLPISSVLFSQNGKYLVTCSKDSTFKIWNVEDELGIINFQQYHTDTICSIAFSKDGKYLATSSVDKICKIWNIEKGFEISNTIKGHTDIIHSVAFSVDGKYLATGSQDNTCKIWNVVQGYQLINTIQDHTEAISSVVFSQDGKYLATGSQDKTCKIWDVKKDFTLINTFEGHDNGINSVNFSIDNKYLATGSKDNTCKIWNVESFILIKTIQGHTDTVYSVAFSPDGKYLATGSQDCKILNVMNGFEVVITIKAHTSIIYQVAFSIDGKYLATGSDDNTCKIWDVEQGFQLINTIEAHDRPIQSIAFCFDGKYLATGSLDKTCKIWNVERGFNLINKIRGNSNSSCFIDFSQDEKYLAIGQNDTAFQIWNLEKGLGFVQIVQQKSDLTNQYNFSDNQLNQTKNKKSTLNKETNQTDHLQQLNKFKLFDQMYQI